MIVFLFCFVFVFTYSYISHLEVHVLLRLLLYKMDSATQVQILNETDCISHSANILVKCMNLKSLLLVMCQV